MQLIPLLLQLIHLLLRLTEQLLFVHGEIPHRHYVAADFSPDSLLSGQEVFVVGYVFGFVFFLGGEDGEGGGVDCLLDEVGEGDGEGGEEAGSEEFEGDGEGHGVWCL